MHDVAVTSACLQDSLTQCPTVTERGDCVPFQ